MEIADKVVVVTGGGHGIGRALCGAFSTAGARAVAVADLDLTAARRVAQEMGGQAFECDVSNETQIQELVAAVEQQLGAIDIFCSNAGISSPDDPESAIAAANNDGWQRSWEVNVMSHVYAARAVIPGMLQRGGGYLVNTASAAGLLQQIGDSAYSTTKHAAVGFAEAMAIAHGDQGIKVSVVCPQYVATRMIGVEDGDTAELQQGVISAAEAAAVVLAGIREERFLILTHPEVAAYWGRKFSDYDRWLGGMRKLRRSVIGDRVGLNLEDLHKFSS